MHDSKLLIKFMWGAIALIFFVLLSNYLINFIYPIQEKDKAGTFISIVSIAAALSAPLAAYIFYDNWKAQTKFNRVTTNILELQKTLHDYVKEFKSLRDRVIFPHSRSKFQEEEDYTNNLKKLFDQKIGEINIAERLKYDSLKILSILRTDTLAVSSSLDGKLSELDDLINTIYLNIQEFKHHYFIFINHYYKDESELKAFMKTEEYKSLTYKISSTRETNNVIKTNIKLALSLEESLINPETTLKIHSFIQDIDYLCTSLLKVYEENFTD